MRCSRGKTLPWNAWKFKLWLCYNLLLWTFAFDFTTVQSQQAFFISEGEPIGTVVGVISNATAPLSVIHVQSSSWSQDLGINTSTGIIKTKNVLDRERIDKYDIFVVPEGSSPVQVYVYVNDVNDNSPKFTRSVYEFTPYEGTNEKRKFQAVDPDKGSNATQQYGIVSGNIGKAFELKTFQDASGLCAELVLASGKVLDREVRDTYLLNISAKDGGNPPRVCFALVNVTVLDVDDNVPVFTSKEYFANVSEGIVKGSNILNVSASDRDIDKNAQIVYSIERGSHSDPDRIFGVNPSTGLIRNNVALDYEKIKNYKIFVVAKNPGSAYYATASVTIRLQDENDNKPVITVTFEQAGSYQVSENARIGTMVARIYTSDRDSGSNGEIDVTLEGGNGHFSARSDPANSVDIILVARELDRESQSDYLLKVVAKDRGKPPLTSEDNFIVNVGDVNDNPPLFDQAVYSVVVSENVTMNSLVVSTHANDKDAGTNAELVYSIAVDQRHSKFRNWFFIDAGTGRISTASLLDREVISQGVLYVWVRDKGTPALSSNCTVMINITDSNDNDPHFNQSVYRKSVVENCQNGTQVLQVFAEDPDTGINGRVRYSLQVDSSVYPHFPFVVNPDTGVILTSGLIDHEKKSLYQFRVVANDGGGRNVSSEVKVSVQDVNDNKPVFNPLNYNVGFLENIPVGHIITVVKATDKDSGKFAKIHYYIVQGNADKLFSINATSGVMYLSKTLDREKEDSHTLQVQATDGEGIQAETTATVHVTVRDVNDAPPVFTRSSYNFSTVENLKPPVLLGSVSATSNDLGVNALISYRIKDGNAEDAFVINSTGSIYLQKAIDHEKHPWILLVVEAQDGGKPPLYGYTNVSVGVIDLNDNSPSFGSPEILVDVREDTKVGQSFYTVSASDLDSGIFGTVVYSFLSNPNATFKLDSRTGALSLQHVIDFEGPTAYTVDILAQDGGSPPRNSTVKLKLRVLDVNDHAPIFGNSSYSVHVIESTPSNSNILKVLASDADTGVNARISYRFKPTVGSGDFGLKPDGWIYIRVALDREARDIYHLIVEATDHGNPAKSSTASVTVYVNDTNDNNPNFKKPSYTFFVKEEEVNRTLVGSVSASDLDAGRNSKLTYKFESHSKEFVISASNGEIRTNQVLDREKTSSYDLMAVVSDSGVNPRTEKTRVTIIVEDINDNSPSFDKSSYMKQVYEDIRVGSSIIAVSANDADHGTNGLVRYSIGSGATNVFQINAQTGLITVANALDREKKDRYILHIVAQDQGLSPRDNIIMATIYVLDVNDNSPRFVNNSYFVNVPEKQAVGSEITAVTANDIDDGNNGKVRYTIDSGNSGDTFKINASSGRIYLQVPLDYERRSNYQLRIVASDLGQNSKSSDIFVTVYVLDANDNRPTFPNNPIVVSVKESVPINHTVTTIKARDDDSGINSWIHYSIQSQSPGTPRFKINPTSGDVQTIASLDRESVDEYTLIVQAEDQAFSEKERLSSTVSLLIIVLDINDNRPKFVSPGVCFVMEDEPFGFPVIDIFATDSDLGKNAKVEYRLASGVLREFALDTSSGSLTLNSRLNYETKAKYVLNITATDEGSPQMSSFQLLTINVVDVNDNAPRFANRSFVGRVAENKGPGTSVIQVVAVDEDSGSNGAMTYNISSGTGKGKFVIDPSTGLITTNVSLDREERDSYSLTVYVTDKAFPFRVDTASVQVQVLDMNDNTPVFHPNVLSLRISENKQHTDFHRVAAQDLDVGSNGKVAYTITQGNEDKRFQIGQFTGALSTNGSLDREQTSQYFLQIKAEDVKPPFFSATANVTVLVTDRNDNQPQFLQDSYQSNISELTKPNTRILNVTATDPDAGSNGAVVYSLSNDAHGLFRVNPSSGDIYTLQSFDYKQKKKFSFHCFATDQGVHPRIRLVSVTVLITDENNHAPEFTEIPYHGRISGNSYGAILIVTATDGDSGVNAKVTYRFNASTPSSLFFLESNTGTLKTKSNSTPDGRYTLYVLATDGGTPPLTGHGIVEILVGVFVDDPPKFLNSSPSSVSLVENSPKGAPVTQLKANKDHVSYSIIDGNHGNAFYINPQTGLLTVANSLQLDYEKVKVFQLYLIVTHNSLNGYMKLYVNLSDENDNAPRVYPANTTVSLKEDNGTVVFSRKSVANLTASDEDSGINAKVTFKIESGDPNGMFTIDQTAGAITTAKLVDHEKADFYELVIKATDGGNPSQSSRSFVKVIIANLNDNPPVFVGQSAVDISEDEKVGTVIASLSAKDADNDKNLVYAFQPGSSSQSVFSIDQFTGAVTLLTALDYESIKHYTLDVSVSDGIYYHTMTLAVNVLDVNDNMPHFLNSSYQVCGSSCFRCLTFTPL